MGNIRIRDSGSGINIPDQQNWKFRRQICYDLKNQIIIERLWKRHFGIKPSHFYNLRSHQWHQREEKTCELDFSISNKTRLPSPNYVSRGKTVTAAYLHKALAKIYSGF
jgi:hypothetical protein